MENAEMVSDLGDAEPLMTKPETQHRKLEIVQVEPRKGGP